MKRLIRPMPTTPRPRTLPALLWRAWSLLRIRARLTLLGAVLFPAIVLVLALARPTTPEPAAPELEPAAPSEPIASAAETKQARGWIPKLFPYESGTIAVFENRALWSVVRLDGEGRAREAPVGMLEARAMDAIELRGGILIVLQTENPGEALGNLTLYRYDPRKHAVTELYALRNKPCSRETGPALATDGDRGLTLYWSSHSGARLLAQRFDPQGRPLGDTTTSRSYGERGAELALAPTKGAPTAVFSVDGNLLHFPALDPTFSREPTTLVAGGGAILGHLVLTANGSSAGLAWTRWVQRAPRQLWFGALNSSGFVTPPTLLDEAGGRRVPWPVSLAEHRGGFLLLFHPGGRGLWSARFDAKGTPIPPRHNLLEYTADMSNMVHTGGELVMVKRALEDDECALYQHELSEDGSAMSPERCCL